MQSRESRSWHHRRARHAPRTADDQQPAAPLVHIGRGRGEPRRDIDDLRVPEQRVADVDADVRDRHLAGETTTRLEAEPRLAGGERDRRVRLDRGTTGEAIICQCGCTSDVPAPSP